MRFNNRIVSLNKLSIFLLAVLIFIIPVYATPPISASNGQISVAGGPTTLNVANGNISVVGGTTTLNVALSGISNGLSGYNITISLSNPEVAEIVSVEFPAWANLSNISSLHSDSIWIKALDTNNETKIGDTNVLLATLTIRGDSQGSSEVIPIVNQIDDDNGGLINAANVSGQLDVIPITVSDFAVNITPSSQTISAGKNLTIKIFANPNNHGVSSGEVDLKFNASVLQVTSLTKGDILGSDAFDTGSSYDNNTGMVLAVLARLGTTTGPTSPGTWATVNLTVNKTAKAGTYTLNITFAGMADETFNDIIDIKINNGSIKVVTLVGDINGDNKVDYKDLGILGSAYGKLRGSPGFREDADLNGDGKIDYKDLGMLGSNYGKTS